MMRIYIALSAYMIIMTAPCFAAETEPDFSALFAYQNPSASSTGNSTIQAPQDHLTFSPADELVDRIKSTPSDFKVSGNATVTLGVLGGDDPMGGTFQAPSIKSGGSAESL